VPEKLSLKNTMNDLFSKTEELHEDLVPFLQQSILGLGIYHPLVHQPIHTPQLNATVNACYLMKKQRIKECEEKSDWSTYVFMHERPYRMDALKLIKNKLSENEFWKLFGSVWIDSENIWQNLPFIRSTLANIDDICGVQQSLMNNAEMDFLKSIPEYIVLWRGHSPGYNKQQNNKKGFSWTFSYWRARWFAQRFSKNNSFVTKATFHKKDIIAILLGRNEMEAIVDYEKATKTNTYKLTNRVFHARRPVWLNDLIPEFISFYIKKQLSYHNFWHWEKVEQNVLKFAEIDSRIDKTVCQAFAWIHDTQRESECDDPEHGARAAEYAGKLHEMGKLKINNSQLQILQEACAYHDKGQISDNPTIGACWDADRLDLTRVSIIPDKRLLSTEAAKNLLWKI
jgi:hypothetical protein